MNTVHAFDWNALDMTVGGLSAHYQRGDFTPAELVDHLLGIDGEDSHNIWISRFSRAQLQPYLTRLAQADQRSLPLYGIPFAVKDNIDVAGFATTAACEAFSYRADADASVVAKLVAAGAIPLGKTNMDQFATGLVGTRSPWGEGKNAFNPDYISGGSSSGSAVATAKGLVSFALDTDTAGSGRVPAMFNNLVGLKPSKGLLSCHGVVPACRSLDCVSIFALTLDDANRILGCAEGVDHADAYSRANPYHNHARHYRCALPVSGSAPIVIGVPAAAQLSFFGDDSARQLFNQAGEALAAIGYQLREVDVSPLLDAAKLLYEGPWVAERYLATEALIRQNPEAMLPVIRTIIGSGEAPKASDCFAAQYRLQAYKQQADALLAGLDALVMPTAPTCYRIDEVNADPIRLNSQLGTYTNFMNLLDMAAVAVPAGFLDSGAGFGITLMGPAFSDRRLLSLANAYCQRTQQQIGALAKPLPATTAESGYPYEQVAVVVCGAHLQGMPLNWQLTERGATLLESTQTAASYRLFAMKDGRPALVYDAEQGAAIEVEVWQMPVEQLGSFVAAIPAPLAIGKCQLADGRQLSGFVAEPRAIQGAEEITALGGWRSYVATR